LSYTGKNREPETGIDHGERAARCIILSLSVFEFESWVYQNFKWQSRNGRPRDFFPYRPACEFVEATRSGGDKRPREL